MANSILLMATTAAPNRAGRGWALLGGKACCPARQPKSRFPDFIIILQTQPKEQIYQSGVGTIDLSVNACDLEEN
jgi:hypothetical protein